MAVSSTPAPTMSMGNISMNFTSPFTKSILLNTTSIIAPTHNCEQSMSTKNLIFTTIGLLAVFISIAGNSLVIFTILMSRQLRMKLSYRLIVSMAVSDMMLALFPSSIKLDLYLHNDNFCRSMSTCIMFLFVDLWFGACNITHLFLIGIDRLVAVSFPYQYSTLFTNTRGNIAIVAMWMYGLLWAGLGRIKWDSKAIVHEIYSASTTYCIMDNKYYVTTMYSVVFLIPMTINTVIYSYLLFIAMKQAKLIQTLAPTHLPGANKESKKGTKAFRTVATVFAAYTLCYLPMVVHGLLSYWSPHVLANWFQSSENSYTIYEMTILHILPKVHSCLNPIIYFLSNAIFLTSFTDLRLRVLGRARAGVIYPDRSGFTGNSKERSQTGVTKTEVKSTAEL